MIRTFRDAFIEVLQESGDTIANVARGSGVSEEQLKKLKQRPGAATNVDDAARVAAYFGLGLDEFLRAPELADRIAIASLYNRLPDELKRQLQAYGQELSEASDRAAPESPSKS